MTKETTGEAVATHADARRPAEASRRPPTCRHNMQTVYDAKPLAYKAAKRAFDIVASAGALAVLSPLLVATAIAVAAEDGLPFIYSAPRLGKDLRPFRMHKFRSMCRDAESKLEELLAENEQTGAAFKIRDDPRITRVGRFIRRTSIDELPQLVNVLVGDMSIVGPRPIQSTRPFTPYENQRLVVRPGITCYWQVAGRADVPWDEWVEMDLDYIEDMSVWTDVRIIARTFGVVLGKAGAH